jgi:hypothetical protein
MSRRKPVNTLTTPTRTSKTCWNLALLGATLGTVAVHGELSEGDIIMRSQGIKVIFLEVKFADNWRGNLGDSYMKTTLLILSFAELFTSDGASADAHFT